jgi:hypothetical protein
MPQPIGTVIAAPFAGAARLALCPNLDVWTNAQGRGSPVSKLIKITLGLASGITLAAAFNADANASCVVTPPPPPSCVSCSGPRTGTSTLPPLSSYFQHRSRCGGTTYHPPVTHAPTTSYHPIVTSQSSASASAHAGTSGASAASHASAGSYSGTSGGYASTSAHASAQAGHSSASAQASASSLSGGYSYAGASAYAGRTATLSPSYAASYATATSTPASSGYGSASASAYASSAGGSAYASASANAVVSSAYQSHQYRQEGFSGTYGGLGPNESLHPTRCPISVHNPNGHQVTGCYKVVKRWTPPQVHRPAPHRVYYRVVRPIIYVRYPVPVCVTGGCTPQPYGGSRYGY